MSLDLQTLLALLIVFIIIGRFVYKLVKQQGKKQVKGGCDCGKNECD